MKNYLVTRDYDLVTDLFDSFFAGQNTLAKRMATNVKKSETGYTLEMEAPGFEKENFNLDYQKNYFTVTVEKNISEEDKKNYISYESATKLQRSFYIPEIDNENITAKYANGVLSVNLPYKKEEDNVKKIVIE